MLSFPLLPRPPWAAPALNQRARVSHNNNPAAENWPTSRLLPQAGPGLHEKPRNKLERESQTTRADARMKLHEDMVVRNEIVDRVFEEDFFTAEDTDIQQDLEKKLEALGLDSTLARKIVDESRQRSQQTRSMAAAQPFSVIPARQWQESKKRLDEEAKRTAKLLLNRTDLKPEGVDLPFKLKPGIGAKTNFIAAFQMVNEGVAKRVGGGRKRAEWSTEEFAAAINLLPEVLNALVREIKKVQNAKG